MSDGRPLALRTVHRGPKRALRTKTGLGGCGAHGHQSSALPLERRKHSGKASDVRTRPAHRAVLRRGGSERAVANANGRAGRNLGRPFLPLSPLPHECPHCK
jgi:hypothetical protein